MAALRTLKSVEEELAEIDEELDLARESRSLLRSGNLRNVNPTKYAWQLEALDRHIKRLGELREEVLRCS